MVKIKRNETWMKLVYSFTFIIGILYFIPTHIWKVCMYVHIQQIGLKMLVMCILSVWDIVKAFNFTCLVIVWSKHFLGTMRWAFVHQAKIVICAVNNSLFSQFCWWNFLVIHTKCYILYACSLSLWWLLQSKKSSDEKQYLNKVESNHMWSMRPETVVK